MIVPRDSFSVDHDPLAELAKNTFLTRKMREEIFDQCLFGEPAWDAILLLFSAGENQRIVVIDELAKSAGISNGTMHRWLRVLEARGMVHLDGEAVELTAEARKRTKQYLSRQMAALMQAMSGFR